MASLYVQELILKPQLRYVGVLLVNKEMRLSKKKD